jgi:hypothetical protein
VHAWLWLANIEVLQLRTVTQTQNFHVYRPWGQLPSWLLWPPSSSHMPPGRSTLCAAMCMCCSPAGTTVPDHICRMCSQEDGVCIRHTVQKLVLFTSMKDLNSSFSSILGLQRMQQPLKIVSGTASGTRSHCSYQHGALARRLRYSQGRRAHSHDLDVHFLHINGPGLKFRPLCVHVRLPQDAMCAEALPDDALQLFRRPGCHPAADGHYAMHAHKSSAHMRT